MSLQKTQKIAFHTLLKIADGLYPSDISLWKIALIARPCNSEYYELHGAVLDNATLGFLKSRLRSDVFAKPLNTINLNKKEIKSPKVADLWERSVLCFSGGFDSLAAKSLLGDDCKLMSIDFGGNFKRVVYFSDALIQMYLIGILEAIEQIRMFTLMKILIGDFYSHHHYVLRMKTS